MEELLTSYAELIRTISRVMNKNNELFVKSDFERLERAKAILASHVTIDVTQIPKQSINENEWIEFEGNENIFGDYSLLNCLCKFDNGMICRYRDHHPIAILTHFKL